MAPHHKGRKCLVLDLDETLLHSSFKVRSLSPLPKRANVKLTSGPLPFPYLNSSDDPSIRLHRPCRDRVSDAQRLCHQAPGSRRVHASDGRDLRGCYLYRFAFQGKPSSIQACPPSFQLTPHDARLHDAEPAHRSTFAYSTPTRFLTCWTSTVSLPTGSSVRAATTTRDTTSRQAFPFPSSPFLSVPHRSSETIAYASPRQIRLSPQDLSQLGRPIDETIIIDNSPASYIFHPNNAVPVSTWFNDPHDAELSDLINFLADLAQVEDVRGVLDGGLM
jgi:hypothetical protein